MDKVNRPLRIGILLRNRHDGPGGLEKVLEIVVKGLKGRPIELFFYALYPPKYQQFTDGFSHLSVLALPKPLAFLEKHLPKSLSRLVRKSYVRLCGHKLFDEMIKDQIDLLITMDLSKQFLTNYSFLKRFKEQCRIPLISWVHSSLSSNNKEVERAVKEKIALFDGHLAISTGIAKEIEEIYQGRNVTVIYNPVEEAELVKRDKSKFLYIGRIDENKRVSSLLAQLKKLKGNWSLDIYGSTGNQDKDLEFQNSIKSLGLEDKVTFHGWKRDVWAEIDSAGIILLNSRREGLPLVLVEAMMRGIPALSSDCPTGPADIITHGENGWLYPVDDENSITLILQNIIDSELILPEPVSVQKSVSKYHFDHYFTAIYNALLKIIK